MPKINMGHMLPHATMQATCNMQHGALLPCTLYYFYGRKCCCDERANDRSILDAVDLKVAKEYDRSLAYIELSTAS